MQMSITQSLLTLVHYSLNGQLMCICPRIMNRYKQHFYRNTCEWGERFTGKSPLNANPSSQNDTGQTLSSFTDCQMSDFTFPFDWNYTMYTPLKWTYRGTWIKKNIKESTSVSLSGSPLNAWSFLICWGGGNRERKLSRLYCFLSTFTVFYYQF